MEELTITGRQVQATGVEAIKKGAQAVISTQEAKEKPYESLKDELHKLRPCPGGGFGVNKVLFEKPEQTVDNELHKLRKMGGDEYFGRQRQYEELQAFSKRLNRRTDLNATHPELTVITTPTYAYSDKHLAAMIEHVDSRLANACSGEERALLEGIKRAVVEAREDRYCNPQFNPKWHKFPFEKPILLKY